MGILMALGALLTRPRRNGAEVVRSEDGGLVATARGLFSPRALEAILRASENAPVRISNLSRRQKLQLRAHRLADLVVDAKKGGGA